MSELLEEWRQRRDGLDSIMGVRETLHHLAWAMQVTEEEWRKAVEFLKDTGMSDAEAEAFLFGVYYGATMHRHSDDIYELVQATTD